MGEPGGGFQQKPPSYSTGLAPGLEIPPQSVGHAGIPQTNYVQMNVHPNPYGHGPPQHGAIGMPQQTHTMRPSNNPFVGQGEPQHQLPSRDIPQDTLQFSNDPEIVPNYIPPAKVASDFVKEYEQSYEKKEKRVQMRDKTARTLELLHSLAYFVPETEKDPGAHNSQPDCPRVSLSVREPIGHGGCVQLPSSKQPPIPTHLSETSQ